jgi:hypothetical protein
MSNYRYLLCRGLYSFCLYSRCSLGSHAYQHNFQLTISQKCLLFQKFLFSIQSWRTFSYRCSNTSKSLISSEYTKVFRCLNSQKFRPLSTGYQADRLAAPPLPVCCPLKVWITCCLPVHKKWIRSCFIRHEPRLLSLMDRYVFQKEHQQIIKQKPMLHNTY